MALVLSIERFTIPLNAATTLATGTLTLGQVAANCVPFMMVDSVPNRPDQRSFRCDAHLAGTTLTVERHEALVNIVAYVVVIEFDPAACTVQSGTWSIANGASTATPAITAVDLTQAAMVFYGESDVTAGDNQAQNSLVEGFFSSDVQLTIRRGSTTGPLPGGHWYVFEAIGTPPAFTVRSFNVPDPGAATSGTVVISPVVTARSFVIASYRAISATESHLIQPVVLLSAPAQVTWQRNGTNSGLEIRGFVVELTHGVVQRGTVTGSTALDTIPIALSPTVDPLRAMGWLPTSSGCNGNVIRTTSGTDGQNNTYGMAVLGTTTTPFDLLTVHRFFNISTTFGWEVVEWDVALFVLSGVTKNNSGTPLGSCDVYLLRENPSGELEHIATTTSHAVTGAYSFNPPTDEAIYLVIARKEGSPNVFDVTDFTLEPVPV